jgi:predicted DNA-binding transcriptional regulator AlpA
VKIGHHVRFDSDDLDTWIEERKLKDASGWSGV